ncbi:serine hydrolase domain-containing protein [Pseudorhodoferax sp.]|uniref:serine hydrolase domain-containing protein n=1 Tax=Pseudorhodoferax sp. TaxID=1993553 RepID=UPI002DD6B327|nr:serine hydrolase domain-containing protein [Pseudorhodoferax sp.]
MDTGVRRRALLVGPALAAAASVASAAAAPAARGAVHPGGFSPAGLRRLARYLDADTDPAAGPSHLGAVVLLARAGQVRHWQAHGRRDIGRREAMPPDAIFRIYSMSKPIASVALLMLLEEGRATLDDPVARFLPEFADLPLWAGGGVDSPLLRAPMRAPALRHLLTHSAGFALAGDDPARALLDRADPQGAADLADYARRVARAPLGAEPGARFVYDGVHTEVLCRVVEVIAGQPFGRFLQQRLFGPLGMVDTGFEVPAAQRGRIADLTVVGDGGRLVLAPPGRDRSAQAPGRRLRDYDSGAGGLYSTAADYLCFAQMLLDDGRWRGRRLLARHSVEAMRRHHLAHLDPIAGLGAGEGFGLGVSVLLDPARRGRLGSPGSFGWPGAATTTFFVDPRERLVALLLMQHLPQGDGPGEPRRPATAFHNLVYQALDP